MGKAGVSIKVRRTHTQSSITSLMRRVEKNSADAAEAFAANTASGAKRRAHVITGHMRNSIQHIRLGGNRHVVRVNAFYGVYEERGTRHRPPHPFFQPAAVAAKAQFNRDMRRVFRR